MADGYQLGFYFKLSFFGEDVSFSEVSGISKEMNVEEVTCGGENRFKYRLPTLTSGQNLVLKRAVITSGSTLTKWCASCIDGGWSAVSKPCDVMLSLLDPQGQVCLSWTFHSAYPVKYSISDLNAQQSDIVMESLELAYTYFDIVSIPNT